MRLVVFCLLVGSVFGQSNRTKIVFHATGVEQSEATDWCNSDKCAATRIKVKGYRVDGDAVIEYGLECVEVVAMEPTTHYTVVCVRLHAHGEYDATLNSDSIYFAPQEDTPKSDSDSDKPMVASYTIKSEREVRKK